MKDLISQLSEQTNVLSFEEIVIRITISVVIGFVIFTSYWISHSGTIYSKKFNTSLVSLTVLTATVMTVIGNNIALSLGMVGALSIVRFRTAIKDSRDTVYIFWTIIGGICCGVGNYLVVAIGSIAVFIILLVLGRIKNDNRVLLIIRASRTSERKIQATVFEYYSKKAVQRVQNTTENSVELIYELSRKMVERSNKNEKSIMDVLYEIGSIEYVNLVAQNDEISS
ncbi:MAG: DUF4956 domain-containing protein [Acetobacterium sp.]|uniref:DUF4956 domain-containing protein n=1 Tax=Acetobacterium sp. TaxID=1872094 RepID=UPI0032429963